MKIAIIGRSELMYNTAVQIRDNGYEIPLVVTAKESPESKVSTEDFFKLAKSCNSIFINSPKINSQENIDIISNIKNINLAVSINYSGIIHEKIINLFSQGILNAHGGDLPRYRGNACQAWAIINGENKIGLCIHKMIAGELDSGDIISREFLPININTRIGEVYKWMEERIPDLVLSSIKKLSENPSYILESQSRDPNKALRTYPRTPDDGRINWNLTNIQITRLINASSEPFSGSFCMFEEEKLTVWRVAIDDDHEKYLAIPGQITKINSNDGSITVVTGQGKVKITEVEKLGNRTKPANIIKSIRKRLQ